MVGDNVLKCKFLSGVRERERESAAEVWSIEDVVQGVRV